MLKVGRNIFLRSLFQSTAIQSFYDAQSELLI